MSDGDTILKEKISEFFSDFRLFLDSLDKNADKNILDEKIIDKIKTYNTTLTEFINENSPLGLIYDNHTSRWVYYNLISSELKKFDVERVDFIERL